MSPTIKKMVSRPWLPKRKPFEGKRLYANTQFYSSPQWRRLRNAFIAKNPLCFHCLKNGKYEPATVVDHIIPINMGGDPLDEKNLQPLCAKCHNAKSAKDKKK